MSKVLYITATWCGPCKMFGPIVDRVKEQYGFDIEKIDADSNQSLLQTFGIRSVPTLVKVDENGRELKRNSGVMTAEALVNWIND